MERLKFWKWFKKKPVNPPFNMQHPDLASHVEFAFEVGGRKFYRFQKDFEMPTGRYGYAEAYLYESELRMKLTVLTAYMDELEKHLDGSKGQISIGKAFQVIWAIRSRCKLPFSIGTIRKLATAVYFDESEDLSGLSEECAEEKLKFWDKHNFTGFFLTKPIIDLLNLNGFSETTLLPYIQQIEQAEQIIRDLTCDPEKPSSPNSSGDVSIS